MKETSIVAFVAPWCGVRCIDNLVFLDVDSDCYISLISTAKRWYRNIAKLRSVYTLSYLAMRSIAMPRRISGFALSRYLFIQSMT